METASLEGDFVQPWGQPNSEAVRLFFNTGYTINDQVELYGFGNYSDSKADGGFFYRFPGNGTIEDLRLEDGSVYSPLEIFPGGFTPRFEGKVTDYSALGGIRGIFAERGTYDVSVRYGFNEVSYTLDNTINPSLGPDTPTSFRPGDLSNEEFQVQADVSWEVDANTYSPIVLAAGVSYMDETYEVQAGEALSFAAGPFATPDPFGFCSDEADVASRTATAAGAGVIGAGSTLNCADSSDPVYRVVGVGSNGFPGFSPAFSDDFNRDSLGVYVDLSADLTERLFLQGAARYEDYSDFGSETVWKLAGRFKFSESLAMRASIGTGFRAPTPGQQGTTNVSTRLPDGVPVATGLFPAGGTIAQALGASDLKAETSDNYSIGLTASLGGVDLTLDYYRIDIDDRVFSISTQPVSSDPTSGLAFDNFNALSNAGVVGAESIGGVFYFTNAFSSKTTGVDLVATYALDWNDGSSTSLTASVNYNKSELASDASEFLNEEDQFDFENLDPNWRGILTAVHNVGRFSILGRVSYFGSSEDSDNTPPGSVQRFGATTFFDLEGTYAFNDNVSLSLGGRNLFDEFPDRIDRSVNGNDYCCGRIYNSGTIVPWQGGFYFLRLNADFN